MSGAEVAEVDTIQHLETCSGCDECLQLLAFYQVCLRCHQWCNNATMTAIPEEGGAICYNCITVEG